MSDKSNHVRGLGTPRLFLSLFIRHCLFTAMAFLVVLIFQRKKLLSGDWLDFNLFLILGISLTVLLALILTIRGLCLARWKEIIWTRGKDIVLISRFRNTRVIIRETEAEAHIGGTVFGMGSKGEIVSNGKKYVFLMGGFSAKEWNAAESTLIALQLKRDQDSDD